MADFYRGSTPTLTFTPIGDIPSGTPVISLSQSNVNLFPTVSVVSGTYSCTLTSSQTASFTISEPVIAQLYFVDTTSTTYLQAHMLSIGENYYDFQEVDDSPESPQHQFELVIAEPDDNPHTEGWYEISDDVYVLTNDTTPDENKEYYMDVLPYFRQTWVPTIEDPTFNEVEDIETGEDGDSPALDEWYELINGKYVRSTDQTPVNGKTYYVLDLDDDYDDEYDAFEETFDGDAFAEDMGVEEDWEDDLDDEDYDIWLEEDVFIDADNIDDFDITYELVTPTGTENPYNMGWLEEVETDEYEFTEDEYVHTGKLYYDMIVMDPETDEEIDPGEDEE